MSLPSSSPPPLLQQFARAVAALDHRYATDTHLTADENQDATLREWLDASAALPWSGPGVTPDEWFFITTLYGEMTLDGQRTHIRAFLPLWAEQARSDMRAVTPEMVSAWRLRSGWMKTRLTRMAQILNERQLAMSDYVSGLRRLEREATPDNPMPALDAIVADHRASGWKTLSVFVRDCVGGNCFPIDSRVAKELARHELPPEERHIVSMSLALGRNPRQVARMFFAAGGE